MQTPRQSSHHLRYTTFQIINVLSIKICDTERSTDLKEHSFLTSLTFHALLGIREQLKPTGAPQTPIGARFHEILDDGGHTPSRGDNEGIQFASYRRRRTRRLARDRAVVLRETSDGNFARCVFGAGYIRIRTVLSNQVFDAFEYHAFVDMSRATYLDQKGPARSYALIDRHRTVPYQEIPELGVRQGVFGGLAQFGYLG